MNFIENVEVHEYEEFVKNHPTITFYAIILLGSK